MTDVCNDFGYKKAQVSEKYQTYNLFKYIQSFPCNEAYFVCHKYNDSDSNLQLQYF